MKTVGAVARVAVAWMALATTLPLAHAQQAAQPRPPAAAASAPRTVSHGLFSDVQLFRPSGAVQQVVLLVSPNLAPNPAERQLIRTMTDAGALVAAVPLEPFYRKLEKQDGKCTYAAGAFENLSRHLQAYEQVPSYLLPMLVGAGSTAAFAYAVLAQAPPGVFASALSVGFCPRLALKTPMCPTNGLRWQAAPKGTVGIDLLPASTPAAPWMSVPGSGTEAAACAPDAALAFVPRLPLAGGTPPPAPAVSPPPSFEAAYARLAVGQVTLAPPPSQLADLPVVELPVAGTGKRFAVLLSGDGGWAAIDKGLAAALVAQNVPVAGFDSLRYFWSARTPEGLAADLDRLIRYYAARWKRSEVILIGYSQGADVLPFAINRLPAGTRGSVKLTALLGLGQKASFEFHFSNWIGPSGDKPIAPEARKLSAADTVCIHGTDERGSLCPQLAPQHVRALALKGGHHFGGDYDKLAALLIESVPR
jgi:type IV secretory pathway VirJ component